jgi:predicted RecA/RadA family phage recombinase
MAKEILSEKYSAYKLAHTAAVAVKEILLLQSKVVMALNASDANAENIYVYRADAIRVPKTAGQAWAPGALIYWDNTAKSFTTTTTSNTLAGYIAAVAASADTEGVIDLDPAA